MLSSERALLWSSDHDTWGSLRILRQASVEGDYWTAEVSETSAETANVSFCRSIPLDAIGKVATKSVHPKAHSFATDDDPSLGQQILNTRSTEREAMVDPNGIGNDLARIAKDLQARH